MEYTYNVIVKTEASRSVPKAINDLTNAQKSASGIFESISNFLSQDFSNTILASLDQRMALWELKQQQIDFPEFFQPVYDGLLEIRAALVTMLDLKEGGFTNTLNALKSASEAMEETGATMKDALVDRYKNLYGGMEGIESKIKRTGRGVYDQIPSSILDPSSGSFISKDEEGNISLTDKFLQAKLGNLDTILKDYPETMATQVKDELNAFLEGMGSGTEMFEKLLGKGTLDFKNWKILQAGLGNINQARKVFKENISNKYDPDPDSNSPISKADKAVMQVVAKPLALGLTAVGDPSRWDQLKEALQKGFFQQLEESGSDILKSIESFGIVSSLFEIVFDQIRESLVKEAHDQSTQPRGKAQSITQLIKGGLKLGKEEIFDVSALQDSIREEISYGQDPFGLNNIRDELEQTLLKAKAEFDPTAGDDDYVSMKDIILKNLEESELPEIVKSTLSEILYERQDDLGDTLQTEIGTLISDMTPDLEKILFIDKLGASFDGIVDIINSFNELPSDEKTNKVINLEANQNAAIDLESVLINNFKETKDHIDNWFRDGMIVGINSILGQIEMMRTDIGFNMTQINRSITNIDIPEQLPATIDQMKRKR